MSEVGDDKIVGHKTMLDGTHVPLRASEAAEIWAQVEASDKARRELMPDSTAALSMLFDARTRLKDEGWREGIYCPKDGSEFAVIQYGSTGIFSAFYSGAWPDGYVMVCDCVERPQGLLWKPLTDLSDAERAKLAECTEAERIMADRELRMFDAMAEIEAAKP